MDADGQHDPGNLPRLLQALESPEAPDLALGSRFLPGSVSFPMGRLKRATIALFRGIVRLATGQRVTDPTSGLQGLCRRLFVHWAAYQGFDAEYPDANMLIQILLEGYRLREVPAVMHPRHAGVSMHAGLKPVLYMLRMTVSLLMVTARVRYRLRGQPAPAAQSPRAESVSPAPPPKRRRVRRRNGAKTPAVEPALAGRGE